MLQVALRHKNGKVNLMLKKLETVVYSSIFLTFMTGHAFAYLDPGTGSMILQGILAAVAGSMFFLRMYWYKFKSFIFGKSRDEKTPPDEKDGEV